MEKYMIFPLKYKGELNLNRNTEIVPSLDLQNLLPRRTFSISIYVYIFYHLLLSNFE